jgi:hypothetical protein
MESVPVLPFITAHELAHTFSWVLEEQLAPRRRARNSALEELFCNTFALAWLVVKPTPWHLSNYASLDRLLQTAEPVDGEEEVVL